ncbi:MAG: alpha-E domain-containing protein [Gemmatimonadaceae bacterium]|nr:alpha-E domain-containing protein [Gemmatimonadaceae bacterium]
MVIVSGEEAAFAARHGDGGEDVGHLVEQHLTWETSNLSSIRRTVTAARENARSIREVISLEVWEAINELYLWLGSDDAHDAYITTRYAFYKRIRSGVRLVAGLLRSTMLHEAPLNFIWLGMLLERGGQTARVLDVHHHVLTERERTHEVAEAALWLAVLRACSGMEPFLKRRHGAITGDAVTAFLLFDVAFPQSVIYCVREARRRFAVIRPPGEPDLPGFATMTRLSMLDGWITSSAPTRAAANVHAYCTHVVQELQAICAGLGAELFGYAPVVVAESPQ